MKLVFLDTKTIGDDIDLSAFDQLGEVVKYSFFPAGRSPGTGYRCRCAHRPIRSGSTKLL